MFKSPQGGAGLGARLVQDSQLDVIMSPVLQAYADFWWGGLQDSFNEKKDFI